MKELKVLYFADVETQPNPEATYHKLYCKSDGWYALDPDGNELRLGAMTIEDETETAFQGATLQFDEGFTVEQVGDKVVVKIEWSDTEGLPTHNNDAHDPNFATEAALQEHLDDTTPHGMDPSLLHEQNKDTKLDEGGANEVSAAEIKELLEAERGAIAKDVAVTSNATFQITSNLRAVLADTSGGNVDLALPSSDMLITCKNIGGNAMTISNTNINLDGTVATGITSDTLGAWVSVLRYDNVWYVIADSGHFNTV